MTDTAASYCADQVRRFDRDRYLTALFAPEPQRSRLMALYAFNLELAKTREVVSEAMLGQIRLQWWRDALQELRAGAPRRHEVIQALAAGVRLDAGLLDAMLDARASDLTDEPFATRDQLLNYVRDTAGGLSRLAAGILASADPATGAVAADAGIAYGLVGLIRAVPFHARGRRLLLPLDLMTANGIDPQSLYDLRPPETLPQALAELAGLADEHLTRARAARRQLPRTLLPGMLLAVLAGRELRRLRRNGFAVFRPYDPEADALWKPLSLTWSALRGRY